MTLLFHRLDRHKSNVTGMAITNNWEQIICIISPHGIKFSNHRKKHDLISILVLRNKKKGSRSRSKLSLGTCSAE